MPRTRIGSVTIAMAALHRATSRGLRSSPCRKLTNNSHVQYDGGSITPTMLTEGLMKRQIRCANKTLLVGCAFVAAFSSYAARGAVITVALKSNDIIFDR